MSWNDPLGFGGLDKVAPPSHQPQELRDRIAAREVRLRELDADIATRAAALPGLDLETRGLSADGAMAALHEARTTELAKAAAELEGLRRERAATVDSELALRRELERVEVGDFGDPRAHLRHPHRPVPPAEIRYGRFVEFWSALSVGFLLLTIVALTSLHLVPLWAAISIAVAGYLVIESAFRRRLTLLTLRVELTLAIIGAIILIWEGKSAILLGAVGLLALVIVLDNVRELRTGGQGRSAPRPPKVEPAEDPGVEPT
jgi:hypothetical protein